MSKSKKFKNLNKNLEYLAQKYYKTSDLKLLTSKQLDNITTWATNLKPNSGTNQDRKAGRSKGRYIKGKL